MRAHSASRGAVTPNQSLERPQGDPAGADDPVLGDQGGHVAERHVGRDEHDAEPVGGEHHRNVHPAGQLGQPLGVPGPAESGLVQGVLLDRRRDDRVHLAAERHRRRPLDGVSRDAARLDGARRARGGDAFPGPQAPPSDGDPMVGPDGPDLVLRPDHRDDGVERGFQRAGRDLRPDPAWIAEGHGDPGFHSPRTST